MGAGLASAMARQLPMATTMAAAGQSQRKGSRGTTRTDLGGEDARQLRSDGSRALPVPSLERGCRRSLQLIPTSLALSTLESF